LWDGADLALNWSSPMIKDSVTDYLFDDIDKDGVREIIILSLRSDGFGGSSINKVSMYKTAKK
jgi:hypothetical protein